MHVVQLNYAIDAGLSDPDEVLARYRTLTGWSDAVAAAGAVRMSVVQRFQRDARVVRNGIEYTFCRSSSVHHAVAGAQPDVVHVNGLIFPAHTWLLRQRLAAPTAMVVQDHGGGVPDSRLGPAGRAIRRWMLGAADAFLF